jgi:2-keto-3-deoxy-L-rhamnonate aldolase RhmA
MPATSETPFGDCFRLTLLTDQPALAARADAAGIDCVGVDIERLGKAERQRGHDMRLSSHELEDLQALRPALSRARLFARLNPPHAGSPQEIERALAWGAQVLMLPFFRTALEAQGFVAAVGGRARTVILVETAASAARLGEVLAVSGVDEVMVGLNDLRLELGARHHFEVLVSPLMEAIAAEVRRAGLPLAVGGVAHPDASGLPVDPDLVLAQYPRLGATGAWISRSFLQGLPDDADALRHAVRRLRERLTAWSLAQPEALQRARAELAEAVGALTSPTGG